MKRKTVLYSELTMDIIKPEFPCSKDTEGFSGDLEQLKKTWFLLFIKNEKMKKN